MDYNKHLLKQKAIIYLVSNSRFEISAAEVVVYKVRLPPGTLVSQFPANVSVERVEAKMFGLLNPCGGKPQRIS